MEVSQYLKLETHSAITFGIQNRLSPRALAPLHRAQPNKPSRKNFRKYSPRSQKGLGKSLMKTRTLLAHRGQRVRNVACNVCTSVLTVHWVSGPSCQCTRRTAQSLEKTPGCDSVSDHNIHPLTIASVANVSATPRTLMVTMVLVSGVTWARVRCAEYSAYQAAQAVQEPVSGAGRGLCSLPGPGIPQCLSPPVTTAQ